MWVGGDGTPDHPRVFGFSALSEAPISTIPGDGERRRRSRMLLSSVERVKNLLASGGKKIADDDEASSAILLSMLREWSARFEALSGRVFETRERTQVFDVEGTLVSLPAFPVDAMAEFEVRYDRSRAFDSSSLVDPHLYWVDRQRGHLILDPFVPACGHQVLQVTWTGGLAAIDGTDGESSQEFIDYYPELAGAIERQVAEQWRRRDAQGAQSTSFGDGSRTYEGQYALLKDVEHALSFYRRLFS